MSDQVHNCPCCGAPLAKPVTLDAVPLMARLNPQQAAIFSVVARKPGEYVHPSRVENEVWADDIDGGPNYPRDALRVLCCQMRPKLAQFGLDIVRGGKGGDRPGWFRLVFIEPVTSKAVA